MKKIIFSLFISIFSFAGFVSANEVDLEQCSSYYDGCNVCGVMNGEVWVCTERYCETYDEPKCLEEKTSDDTKQQAFCTQYGGVLEKQSNTCSFGNKEINVQALYSSYLDFSGQMMYMWGSKYFDERTGFYNYDLVRSDLNTLWFIRLNVTKLYNQYQQNIDMTMDSLQNKLDSQNETRSKFAEILGDKILHRVDQAVYKFIDSTAGMSHAKKEIYLIKKVEILSDIRERYSNNSNTSKQVLTLIDYFIYKFERYIAYE